MNVRFFDGQYSNAYYGNYFGSKETIVYLHTECVATIWNCGEPLAEIQHYISIVFSQKYNDRHTMVEIHYVTFFMPGRLMWFYLFLAKHNDWKDLLNIKVQSIFRRLPINFLEDWNVMKDCIFVFAVHYFIFLWFICC